MLRYVGILTICLATATSAAQTLAQEAAAEPNPRRVQLRKSLEAIAPELRSATAPRDAAPRTRGGLPDKTLDQVRDYARHKLAPTSPAASLADFGAGGPFDYSASGRFLAAAVRDGEGLAVWDTVQRKRLHRLENSNHRYALVAISDEARWIAAVRQDDVEQIDLWRADNGRYVRTVQAAGGPKTRLEFRAGAELHVTAENGDRLAFSIPNGRAIGALSSQPRKSAPSPPIDAPKIAAPKTFRSAPRVRPPVAGQTRSPSIAQPPAMAPPPALAQPPDEAEQPDEPTRAPRMAAPRARAAAPPREESFAPPAAAGPSAPMSDRAPQLPLPSIAAPAPVSEPASAAPGEPGSAAPDEPAASAPQEPASSAPDEPTSAAPEEPVGSGAPETAEAPPDSAVDEPAPTSRQFRFEMPSEPSSPGSSAAEPPTGASPTTDIPTTDAPAIATPPSAEPRAATSPTVAPKTPTSVNIHFATNRNRLAPKDREWLVYFQGFFTSLPAFVIYAVLMVVLLALPWFGKRSWALPSIAIGGLALCAMGLLESYVRSQLRDELSGELYGCRPVELSYGTCEISVPPPANRRAGDLSRPVSVWVFEAPENPDKHFILRHVEEHSDKDAFYSSLSARLAMSDSGAALLFVHGYNVSFEDAIFRTAQLAVDLKFPGAPMAFCWPSYADPLKYTFDEQNAEVSIPALREVLDDLASRSGAKRIHIIAHSMGNRVLAGALRNMDPATWDRNKQVFHELVLAAPDIDSRVFRSQVLPHIVHNTRHCTLYASSRDRALLMSRFFHNYQRLGETQPELLVADNIDTIDASMVDTSLLGHSYIGDVQSIVSDLHELVVGGKRPTDRLGLLLHDALKYWSIRPEIQTATDPALRR